ncbi:MAG: tetratricopeptide repeat protein [Candidatus Aureabacteria bacterium]|nr:tetratricopeptide repeat protein [Candidatus Auribacterota bacterium]
MKKLVVAVIIVLFSGFVSAGEYALYEKEGLTSPEWNLDVEKGFNRYEAWRLDEAMTYLEKAVNKGCEDGLVLYRLAACYANDEQYKKSIEYFKRAIKSLRVRYPKHRYYSDAYYNLGSAYMRLANLEAAGSQYEESIRINSQNFNALKGLGFICYEKGQMNKAAKYFKDALKINPEDLSSLLKLGTICRRNRDNEGALKYFNEALGYYPDSHKVYTSLGVTYDAMDDVDKSIEFFKKAVALKEDAVVFSYLGMAYIKKNDLNEAEKCLLKAKELKPGLKEALFSLGLLYFKRLEFNKAEEQYMTVLKEDPEDIAALSMMGVIKEKQNNMDEAVDYYKKVLSINANVPGAHLSLGDIYFSAENWEGALKHYNDFLKIAKNIPSEEEIKGKILKCEEMIKEINKIGD